jgi:hypothetical protein
LTSAVITAKRPVVDATIKVSLVGNIDKTDEMDTPEYEPSPEAYQPKTASEESLDDKIAHILGNSTTTGHRHPSSKMRSMPRCNKAHACHDACVRKDHGTTARRKQIEAINAANASGKQSKRTVRRRVKKNAVASGNPRRYKAALKRQARTGR